MKFKKAYIEITNICGLECSFCPTKTNPTTTMSLETFSHILKQLKVYCDEIYLHVLGDPLSLSNLFDYLDIAYKMQFKVNITTSGYYLKNHKNIFHLSIKQINVSLNSFNKNAMKISFDEYMSEVLNLCDRRENDEVFINLRLWNLDENNSENAYNQRVFDVLEKHFQLNIAKENKTLRLAKKILLHFDNYFQWPSLSNTHFSHGYCHGLSSQIAILADGRVVPCCLDADAVVALGNLHVKSLKEILETEKVKQIQANFKNNIAVEKLCQKCSFKDRFNEVL